MNQADRLRPTQRDALLHNLKDGRTFDVAVIGGGATGLGVALESVVNAGGHLADGKLKMIFGQDKAIRVKAHFAVYPERHGKRPAVEAFLSWLHGEAAKT